MPWVWCILFFLMMITIGFGSILSLMECVLDCLITVFNRKLESHFSKTMFRICFIVLLFLVGLPMTTQSGIYIQNLIDGYLGGYPVLIYAALESVVLGWIYGFARLRKDLKMMLGAYPSIFWKVCFVFFTPVIAITILVFQIIAGLDITLGKYEYPAGAQAIGWAIVVVVLLPIPIRFFIEFKKSNFTNIKQVSFIHFVCFTLKFFNSNSKFF